MLQVEHGGQQLTSESPVHPLRTDASSGVGNSSAQTVDAHVPREWEEPASEALREGWSEAEVCAEEVAASRKPMRLQRGRACRSREAAPTPSRSSYRQGRRKAPSGSSSTAQSKAPSERATCLTAASRRATCRTGIIEKQLPPGTAQSTIGKQLHSAKQGVIGTSNLPNQQHREADVLANNGAKWGGAEGVRGRNLACFLKNFVSNYIVIFLMMLFRVHL